MAPPQVHQRDLLLLSILSMQCPLQVQSENTAADKENRLVTWITGFQEELNKLKRRYIMDLKPNSTSKASSRGQDFSSSYKEIISPFPNQYETFTHSNKKYRKKILSLFYTYIHSTLLFAKFLQHLRSCAFNFARVHRMYTG